MILRNYQEAAVNALEMHLALRPDNPCVVIPTGGGKTIVIAEFIKRQIEKRLDIRICVLVHTKELISQNFEKFCLHFPFADVGVFSAGLKRKDNAQILFAGIQSIINAEIKPFNVIIIDEAHRIPVEGEGQYRRFLTDQWYANKNLRIVGMTATPYRMKDGLICDSKNILNKIVYEASIPRLIHDGFLCAVISSRGSVKMDFSGVKIRSGEYAEDEVQAVMTTAGTTQKIVSDILSMAGNRKHWLIFCAGIKHAEEVNIEILSRGISSCVVHSLCNDTERDERINAFKMKKVQVLVNVSLLTEGFDASHIDLIALLRPTKSPGLYYQMVGRGLRIDSVKKDCLILDYGQNISRHGAIDAISINKKKVIETDKKAPTKKCPSCGFPNHTAARECIECGFIFPEREAELTEKSANDSILSVDGWVKVEDVSYEYHHSRKEGKPDSLKITYHCGWTDKFSEWICLLHPGFAGEKAKDWFYRATQGKIDWSSTCIEDLVDLGENGFLFDPVEIYVKKVNKFYEIKNKKFDYAQPIPHAYCMKCADFKGFVEQENGFFCECGAILRLFMQNPVKKSITYSETVDYVSDDLPF